MGYNSAKQFSKHKEDFGHGAIEGVCGSEAANNAVTGGSLIPMLTLGIPGESVTAVLMGGLVIQGLAPGPELFTKYAPMTYTFFAGFVLVQFFMLATGIGLMFGVGVSVVASIHLSRGRVKAANINITQAYSVSLFFTLIASALGLVFDRELAFLFGSSERLLPYVLEYLHRVLPFMAFYMLLQVGMFVIRLDGSPRFAMWCNAIPALVNLVLDYIFIVPLDWGIAGAAWAFDSGVVIGSLMIIIYTTKCSYTLRLYRIKLSRTSIRLTRRNIGYMLNIGTPAMLNEVAIACMMLIGNYVFIHYLGEDGVAAFSVACYCFPLVFMINNAIAQSAQPIISYNYGTGDFRRVRYTFRLALYTAVTCGLLAAFAVWFSIEPLIALFLEPGCNAYHIAVSGMAYFATGFLFFALNIVCIGYLQSIERARPAQLFTLLRSRRPSRS